MKKKSFVLRRMAGGSAKLIISALAFQEDYGPLERRVFDYNSQGKSQGLLLLFNGLEMRRLRG